MPNQRGIMAISSEISVNTAREFVTGFYAGYEGTELDAPIKAAFAQKLKEMSVDVMAHKKKRVARAVNGFQQFVVHNEDTDQKVVRMLKAALYAHTENSELEVHYAEDSEEDDPEFVARTNECLALESPKEMVGAEKTAEMTMREAR
ncbi:hypothetical protein EJ03DRAFT_354820 [Teratosphaeria nubilosa]|uniref:Uncharacterized protein n=1 Tax=Teratosphaeria nubilosa TaxID=161662 RepID=A0A6G1KYF6_9PEZI|nr:hypothetical protein EJ03DRAFT_354820 [Teratosphaeria nubilosa]